MLESRLAGVEGDSALVELGGEMEYGAFGGWSDDLTRVVREACAQGTAGVTIDVGTLRFIDLEGVAILLRLAESLRSDGKVFRIRGAGGQVAKKLQETGVLGYLSG